MKRIEFGADQVWPHPNHAVLAGRVYGADILLGDVFTELTWTPWLAEPIDGSHVGEPTVTHSVKLRVEGIEAYQQPLEFLSSGMTGVLKLTGAGRELLRAFGNKDRIACFAGVSHPYFPDALKVVDPADRAGAWLLVGNRSAELGAAVDSGA